MPNTYYTEDQSPVARFAEIASENATVSTGTDTIEVEFNVSTEDIINQMENEIRYEMETSAFSMDQNPLETGSGPSFVNNSPSIEFMEEPTREAFIYEKAIDRMDEQDVAAAYAGSMNRANGVDGVKLMLFESAYEAATNAIDNGASHVEAFNEVTHDWPHILRAEYASYEYANERGGDDDFHDEVERFAESEGVLDMEFTQTELDAYFEDNPFHDSELSEEEARAVMMARHYDIDGRDINFDNVVNMDDYLWWLKETQDVETSERAHHYGTDVSEDIIAQAAPPSAWENLDPDNIEEAVEFGTGNDAFYIHHHEQGETWVSDDGPIDGERMGDFDSRLVDVNDNSSGRIMPSSREESMNFPETFAVTDGNAVARFGRERDIIRQDGDHDFIADLDDESFEIISRLASGESGGSLDLVYLEPQERPGTNTEEQRNFLEYAVDNPDVLTEVFDGGPAIVRKRAGIGSTEYTVYFQRDDPETAQLTKEALEDPGGYMPTAQLTI